MASDEERKARNEVIFREANEEIRREAVDLGYVQGHIPFVCECEEPRCTTLVPMTPREYEAVRTNPRTFLLAPGHPSSTGIVLAEHERYSVAEKQGLAGEIAEEHAPGRVM